VAGEAIETCQFRDVQEMRVMQNELAFAGPEEASALQTMIQVRPRTVPEDCPRTVLGLKLFSLHFIDIS
jgi:hypothetical protein